MILGVNGRFLGARATGVQRFAREIMGRIWEHAERGVLLLPADVSPPEDLPASVQVARGRRKGHFWERIELPRQARDAGCSVLLHLANTVPRGGVPHVVVVHDVEPLAHPERFARPFAAWYRWIVAPAVREAAAVVTVSQASARAIVQTLGLDVARIRVADQGAAPLDRPAAPEAVAAVRRRFGLVGPYVLAVGGGDPRKNVGFLRGVVAALPSHPQLAVVSGVDRRLFAAEHDVQAAGEVRLGRVDDETLRALYTGAAALGFPSLSEGFGRPPLEALACGAPVVVAPYAAAVETLGEAAQIVPLEARAWVEALLALFAESAPEAAARRARGRAQAARHSWDDGVLSVVAACREAAGEERVARRSSRTVHAVVEPKPQPQPDAPAPGPFAYLRVALVHDWLTSMRGGERVLAALLELFPRSDIFTLVRVPGSTCEAIESRRIETSFVQRLPAAESRYRSYLPLFPRAIESLDLSGYDLVASSSHCVAKGALAPAGAPHLCYCHTPMRYIWDQADAYLAPGRASPLVRAVAPAVASRLRRWDVESAARVHRFVANSEHVRGRIRRYWGRESEVVYPPVEVERFSGSGAREDFHLVVSALVPYKRVDLAIEACARLGRRLVIVGDGPDKRRLAQSAGPSVTFAGRVEEAELVDLMRRCRAFIHPAVEDFGIAVVEAQAAGAPVVAARAGGALETVIAPGAAAEPTGLFFEPESSASLADALLAVDALGLDPAAALTNARRFGRAAFLRGMTEQIAAVLAEPPTSFAELGPALARA